MITVFSIWKPDPINEPSVVFHAPMSFAFFLSAREKDCIFEYMEKDSVELYGDSTERVYYHIELGADDAGEPVVIARLADYLNLLWGI